LIPGGLRIDGVGVPSELDASSPLLSVLTKGLFGTIMIPAVAAIVFGLLGIYFRSTAVRVLLGLFLVLSFLPSQARRPAEYLAGATSIAISAAGCLILARFFL